MLFYVPIASAYEVSRNIYSSLQDMLNGKIEEAIQKLKQSSATNDVLAQFYIAQCYEYGIGMETDLNAAFSMYRRTAERGFAPGMHNLARCYREGIGVHINQARAMEIQNRYYKRNFTDQIPDLLAIYQEGIKKITNSNVSTQTTQYLQSNQQATDLTQFSPLTTQQSVLPNNKNNISEPEITITSDVDIDIPITHEYAENVFALIIANENYQDAPNVQYALNDGDIMAKYCMNTLGLPQSNIHLVKDATLNNIKREINLVRQIAHAYDGDISLIVYYAGHGIPDEKTNKAYLMPIDGFSTDLTTCLSMSDFYESFNSIPTSKTIMILDACFSGSARGDNMLYAARGVKIKPKTDRPCGNTIVISSAQGDETAFPYKTQNHGLFTYFLLKKLKESKGNVVLGSLFDYVKDSVLKKSLLVNGKSQTPIINAADPVVDLWYNWKLN